MGVLTESNSQKLGGGAPLIFITLGDPKSVNIEILWSCLKQSTVDQPKYPTARFILIGSKSAWLDQSPLFSGSEIKMNFVSSLLELSQQTLESCQIYFINTDKQSQAELYSDAFRGNSMLASLEALRLAIQFSMKNSLEFAVITLPIDKSLAHRAGFAFDGHTEFLQNVAGSAAVMTLVSQKMTVGLVTNHLALSHVPAAICVETVVQKLELFITGLSRQFHLFDPTIAVCGLNPHCGDSGDFGEEEVKIKQAIEHVQAKFPRVRLHGPVSGDTVFYQHLNREYDAVLAMYHDQGLIPIKTVSFDTAVNVSLGLPFLRVSPDHGPATNIFKKGKARSGSLETCFRIVREYFRETKK